MSRDPKAEQDYDPNPPRCYECVYFSRRPVKDFTERTVTTRKGTKKVVKVPVRRSRANPVVERCTFGNFEVTGRGVCNEWRNRNGERIEGDD